MFNNAEISGQKNNPIFIGSSSDQSESADDESESESENIQNEFNHLFDPQFPPAPPPLQAPPPIFPPQQEQQRPLGFGDGIFDFFGNFRRFLQPPPPNNLAQNNAGFFNFQINQPNNFNRGFFGFNSINSQPQPPQPDNTKKKNIKLNGINFTIIDVPHKVLGIIKKGSNVSPNFIMGRASSYIQMVLQHGEIPDDLLDRLVIAACDPKTSQSNSFLNDCNNVLRNFFPSHKVADLRKALQMNKLFITDTIDFLKKDTTFKKMSKSRIPCTDLVITDPIVSVQLDELYSEYEKERKKKEKEEEEEKQIEQAKNDGSLIECECCICEYPIDWMIQCPEGHLMCKKCVERQIETAISEGRSNVPCLKFGGCDQNISMAELQRLIPKKTLERLVATETLNAITAAGIDHTVTCHKCGYIVIYDGNGPMNCPQCKAQTCPKCGGAWHPNMTCEQFKEIDKDRLVEEQMNEAVVRTCPKCKTQFMKDEGCNKMECPRCHTWICYWCRKVIPKEVGYEHFWRQQGPCPPDKCPLWVQNDTLHLIEAEKAKDQAKDDMQKTNLNMDNEEEEDQNEN